jgi:tyrosine aminotransferase
LTHLESLVDSRTRAVLVNNPSNPCGAVYTEEHLRDIIHACERHHLPIIADEIYADMVRIISIKNSLNIVYFLKVFSNNTFYFLGILSENVPVLSCGGISKRFICPGWRVGWIVLHDRNNLLKGKE